MSEIVLGPQAYTHHGEPYLFQRDINIIKQTILWMAIARYENKNKPHSSYGDDWYPSNADISKSRLFWRIRAGQKILTNAPPTAMSCPWYEVIEDIRPHWVYDMNIMTEVFGVKQDPPLVSISGTSFFKLLETIDENHHVVEFKPWTFDLWNAPNEQATYNPATGQTEMKMINGWWLQRRVVEGEKIYLDIDHTSEFYDNTGLGVVFARKHI